MSSVKGCSTTCDRSRTGIRSLATFAGREHLVPSDGVFRVIARTKLSAYDAEFVALAEALDVPLVTADKLVLKECPGQAHTMEAFVSR